MFTSHYLSILALLLAGAGLWLMLPRGGARGRGLGMAMMAIALGLGASRLPMLDTWTGEGVFLVLAAVTVVSALGAVTFRNPVYCAIWFGLSLVGVAGLFLFIGAQFLAAATIIVYAGAILVTFLFVLMLAQPEGRAACDRVSWEAPLAAAAGAVMVGLLSTTIGKAFIVMENMAPPTEETLDRGILASQHVAHLGGELFGRHLIAIEVAGVLLLVALVGAAVIVGTREGRKAEGGGRRNMEIGNP